MPWKYFSCCAMLGFRGEKSPEQLRDWHDKIKTQLEQGQGPDFNLPVEGQARTFVPPLSGARRLQNYAARRRRDPAYPIPALAFLAVLMLGN